MFCHFEKENINNVENPGALLSRPTGAGMHFFFVLMWSSLFIPKMRTNVFMALLLTPQRLLNTFNNVLESEGNF